ncbi:uncharacterized protein LOC112090269 [Morus notabilis]|uniref:uncharacterized protein LOC112090269 n=1 Tax=Morus notabilis TaxID=981085 RepID=UPI000CED2170|nr:uncharacterized protein LOC112090269 [Morus notabilis]
MGRSSLWLKSPTTTLPTTVGLLSVARYSMIGKKSSDIITCLELLWLNSEEQKYVQTLCLEMEEQGCVWFVGFWRWQYQFQRNGFSISVIYIFKGLRIIQMISFMKRINQMTIM